MLVRGTMKILKWRLVHQGSVQPAALHLCAWNLITRVLRWGPLGRPLCWCPCYHHWITWGECVRRLLTWKEAMEKKGLRVNAGKTKIMICGTGLDLLQSSGEFPCEVCRTGVGSHSIFCNGCKHWVHKKCIGLKGLKKDPDYRCTRCQGTARPLDGRPQKEVHVGPDKLFIYIWNKTRLVCNMTRYHVIMTVLLILSHLLNICLILGGSFLLLPRRHALSSRWLWTFNHNMCENHLEEVQGSATSSLFTSPLFQNMWPCVQLLCVQRNAPCQRNLAIDKAKPPASAAKWQGKDQTDLQCQAARHCHHQVQWATCMAWHWGSGPHSEGEKTPMVWTCGTLQWCSQDSLWHSGWWKAWAWEAQDDMETADREGLQRVESTLMIDIPGDLVWDLPCVQQASYLEGGPLVWMLPLYLHVIQKSDYDMMMMETICMEYQCLFSQKKKEKKRKGSKCHLQKFLPSMLSIIFNMLFAALANDKCMSIV